MRKFHEEEEIQIRRKANIENHDYPQKKQKMLLLLAVSLLSVYSTMAKESLFFFKKKANTKHC